MINIPKDLSDIEVGLYKSGYGFCEKLVKENIWLLQQQLKKRRKIWRLKYDF